MTDTTTDRDELVRRALALPAWFHTIELDDGVTTPGVWGEQHHIREALDRVDFRDARVLDVGCLDGRWTFEAERRGAAEVYATDLLSQVVDPGRAEYFEIAAEILGSRARYDPNLSVYDVARLGVRDFDVVLFLGVFYHLKSPLLALARLRQIMREGATIVVEGQVIHDEVSYARFFYGQAFYGDRSNWWIPSIACLTEWLESSFLEVGWANTMEPVTWDCLDATSRAVVLAKAVRRADPKLVVPDEELREFDENVYG